MSQKMQCDQLNAYATKYSFEYNKYVLPLFKDEAEEKYICESGTKLVNPTLDLEPFKNEYTPIKPEICTYSFMSEQEIIEVKNETDPQHLIEIFENKFTKLTIKGPPKKLLIELMISIIKFSNKYLYDVPQTGAILAMFYNTHLFLSYNLFATPENVYEFFREYIYFHSISVPPYKTKLFEPKEAHKIMMYFGSNYLRNLPLVRLLMFPNYGLLLQTKNPVSLEELANTKKGKGAKGKETKGKETKGKETKDKKKGKK